LLKFAHDPVRNPDEVAKVHDGEDPSWIFSADADASPSLTRFPIAGA
jgi:hypothetical protein